jgi:hypothetical protein
MEGIGIRYGCHCAHLLVKHILHVPPSVEKLQRVIVSLFPKVELPGVARVSLGIGTTMEDIDDLIRVLGKIAGKNKPQYQLSDSATLPSKKLLKQKMKEFVRTVENEVFDSSLQSE